MDPPVYGEEDVYRFILMGVLFTLGVNTLASINIRLTVCG